MFWNNAKNATGGVAWISATGSLRIDWHLRFNSREVIH
jgi:hypothetical protein